MIHVDNRLKKLEKERTTEYNEVISLIKKGAYYDDVSDDVKELYCEYKGTTREVLETIEEMVAGNLHFQMELNPTREPTSKELQQIAEEIREYLEL